MKPSDIKIGRTYRNRGKGRTLRKVVAIGPDLRANLRANLRASLRASLEEDL